MAECVSGMVARRGEKATNLRSVLGNAMLDEIWWGVGLVKPKRRGVVLVEVAEGLKRGCRE